MIAVAIFFAMVGKDILVAGSVGISWYFRDLVKDKRPSLETLISFNVVWKWFTVLYYLIVAALALHFMGELYRLGPGLFVLIFMFPIAIAWIRYDWLLFKNLENT